MKALSSIALSIPLILFAAPIVAQTPDCGGIGAAGVWIGGNAVASDPATSETALTLPEIFVPLGGQAVALFTLSEPQTVRIEARSTRPDGDPVIELFAADGAMVITDDDSGGGLHARAEPELAAGDYCLAVRGFGGAVLSAEIRVGRLEHEPLTEGFRGGFFEPAGTGAEAPFVGIEPCTPTTPATTLGPAPLDAALAGDGLEATNTAAGVPYYRFTLDQPRTLSIRALNEIADPYIYLFDGAGALIAENDDYESLNARIDLTEPLPAGTYCIGMRALSDPNLPVTLRVVAFDAAAARAELVATGDAASPLDGSWPVAGMGALPPVSVRDIQVDGTRAQWLSFDIAASTVLVIEAVEVTDSDPLIILYDDAGREIAYSDDANGTLNSQILLRLDPGRYLLAVRQYSDGSRGTIRLVTERFVRAPE